MSNTLRTWIAGLLLACSVLLVVASADAEGLAVRAMLAMTVVLCHCWVIAVGERSGTRRGGLHLTRFPIGPRLLAARPGLTAQCLLVPLMIGAITLDWRVAVFGVALVLTLTVDLLRRWLPFIIPMGLVVTAVAGMNEFHTLGDLVETARGWVFSLMWMLLWVTLLAGPLLRADAGGALPGGAKVAVLLAGLPSYAGGLFVLQHTSLGQQLPDLLGLALVLLAGGVVQSAVLMLCSRALGLADRDSTELPPLCSRDIGLALMPFGLVLLAVLSLEWLQLSSGALGRGTPAMWQLLMLLGLIVPAVPAAALVASALDRVDGRSRGLAGSLCAVAALGLWLAVGPLAMRGLYASGGLIEGVSGLLPGLAEPSSVFVGSVEEQGASVLLPAGDLTIWGMPAADMLRACTLMLLAVSAWSARLLRHAALELSSPGPGLQGLACVLAGLLAWIFVPRIGPLAAPLAVAGAATVAMALDLVTGVKLAPVEADVNIAAMDFSSPLLDELALEADAPVALAPAPGAAGESDELSFSDWNEAEFDEPESQQLPS